MSYIEQNLIANEKIIYQGFIHPVFYIKIYFTAILIPFVLFFALMFLGSIKINPNIFHYFYYFKILLILFASFLELNVFYQYLKLASLELAVTDKRILVKRGVLRIDTFEVGHQKVEVIDIDQSFFGRLIGFGDITIIGTGGTQVRLNGISKPFVFRKMAATEES